MWQWIRSIFQRERGGSPEGFAMRDASVDAAVDRVLERVVLQLGTGQPTLDQLRASQSTILGYVATLAGLESKKLTERDQNVAAALISILVAGRLSGKSVDPELGESLMSEFKELEEARDFDYGQGGAMALEDFEHSAQGRVPHALALWMKQARGAESAG